MNLNVLLSDLIHFHKYTIFVMLPDPWIENFCLLKPCIQLIALLVEILHKLIDDVFILGLEASVVSLSLHVHFELLPDHVYLDLIIRLGLMQDNFNYLHGVLLHLLHLLPTLVQGFSYLVL